MMTVSRQPAGRSSLYIHKDAGVTVVEFMQVRMLDDTNINMMTHELFNLVDKTLDLKILIDFSNIKYMSSIVLGKIIELHKRITKRKGTLKLCSIDKKIMQVFKVMKLDKVLEICKDYKRAMNSFNK
jgi:anti-sigma B factor antagonist